MDVSARDISLSSSSQPSANPRILIADSKEADENDQMISKNQNMKKLPMKHFMTPTISATSKASIPRNKILTERNESSDSSGTHQQNTPNNVPKTSQVHLHNSSSKTFSQKSAFENRYYESEDDEHKDSSAKPYDPLTNYLSPRPKFLRFNPNKSREIYNRRETEIDKEDEGSDDRSSSVSSSIKSFDEIENEEIDIVNKDDEDEIEDIENEGDFSGVFKFTLVSIVLLLLTWYISCMNSSTPSPTLHLIRGSTKAYVGGYNRTYDIVDVRNKGEEKEFNGISDHVLEKEWEVYLKPNKDGGFVVSNHEAAENVNEQNFKIEMDSCDQTRDGIIETAEKLKSFQDDQIPTFPDLVSVQYLERVLEGDGHDKGDENAEIGDKFKSSELVDTYVSDCEERGDSVSLVSEVEIKEGDEKLEENAMNSAEEGSSLEFFSTKDSESNLIYGTFIGIFVIIASSIIAFYSKCIRTPIEKSQSIKKPLYDNILTEKSQSIEKPLYDNILTGKSQSIEKPLYDSTENISSQNQTIPNLEEAHIKKVESYVNNPSTYVPWVEENAQDFSSTCAPTVELLGEFIVGDVRSSIKSCSFKSKTKENEMKPKEMESEGDTNSIFLDRVVNNMGYLSTPEISASTAMDSPSYGSFTDKKKIVKKEEGSVMTTPVRRSSRIRNRAMSP